jgi:DNA repair protein RecO (recombination protein O)
LTESPRHDRLYKCEAIVLQGIDFKEADRILTLYSREYGKISVIAKAIRKPTSRLGSSLDHLSQVRLTLAHSQNVDIVTNVELVDAHLALSGNIEAYAYASHLAELVHRLTQERQENRKAFALLAGGLKAISDGVDAFSAARFFELSLFSILGFGIELYRCVSCGRELQADVNPLSARLGGFLCPQCLDQDRAAVNMSVNAQKYMRLLDRGGLDNTIHRSIGDDLKRELEAAMLKYARAQAERELTSLVVLRSLQPDPTSSSANES